MSDLKLSKVSKIFGDVHAVRDVDLDVRDGEFVVFVGPSGCGKSTLLRIVAGLEAASAGDILLDGRRVNDVSAADRGLAMVFQSYALYPHMSVRQNLAFGLENSRMKRAEIETRVAEAARMLQIEPLMARKPRQLSGGQRQRVAIGRAIVRRPRIFLLDEPLSNLDAELRVTMRAELAALHARLGATMIYVTHDQVEAMTLADRIVVLKDGRVVQVGPPLDLFNHPADMFVAGFIGAPRMNFLPAVADDGGFVLADGTRVKAVNDASGAVTLGVRPQHVAIGDEGLAARVALSEQLGAETIVHCIVDGMPPLIIAKPGQLPIRMGETLRLSFPAEHVHVFGSDGAAA